ncbi:MAG TPA: nitrile hydratase subunit alpha [Polyangiaceae bacterium]|nr:nitrile hydratase subunit alpha [Polyangiaceae bacterium]
MNDEHDHDHDHEGHGQSASMASRVAALVAKLEARGILTGAELDAAAESFLTSTQRAMGPALVARAWVDGAFRARLLTDANGALDELGIDMTHWAKVKLRAVENTDRVHNVIVCTLCSCYPVALLGPSPSWYKSLAYRSRVVREPRAVLAEFGVELDPSIDLRVWDSTADLRYVVIPRRPEGTNGAGEAELAALVTRDALIGTAVCRV